MITTGYWCDECRRKYVKHMCHGRRLPCTHSFHAAIPVWCQAFARGGEHVCIGKEDVWLHRRPKEKNTIYCGDAQFWWNTDVEDVKAGRSVLVGEWLAVRSGAFIRAFLGRWESSRGTPDWVGFRNHPYADRACALMLRK